MSETPPSLPSAKEVVTIPIAGFCFWPVLIIGIKSSLQQKIAIKLDKTYKASYDPWEKETHERNSMITVWISQHSTWEHILPWGSDSIVGFKRQRLEFLASELMAICRVESCTEMVSIRTTWCKGWSCYIQSEIQWSLAEITCLQEVWEVNVNIRGHAYQKINEVLTQLQWRNHTKHIVLWIKFPERPSSGMRDMSQDLI